MTYEEETQIYLECAKRLREKGFHILASMVEEIARMTEEEVNEKSQEKWKEVSL